MKFRTRFIVSAVTALGLAASAQAATVDITITEIVPTGNYGDNDHIADGLAALEAHFASGNILKESFEGYTAGSTPDPQTLVGDFVGLDTLSAGNGSGSTAIPCGDAPRGTTSCVKPGGTAGGRYPTEGDNWLDSNDLDTIEWTLPGVNGPTPSRFNKIGFLLTDVDDVGSFVFSITADGTDYDLNTETNDMTSGKNASLHLVLLEFGDFVDNTVITMTNGRNDGFGMDSIRISAVPLPAAGWMLLAGMGGLGAMRRFRRKS